MKILMVFFMTLTVASHAASDVEEAVQSVRALIRPLMPGIKSEKTLPAELSGFRVDACEKHKVDWMNVLLMKTSLTLDYKFKKGCDIQGSVSPKIFQPFPAAFDLQNLKNYTAIASENRITATMESLPIMNLEMTKGELKGPKGLVKFEADYKVQLNPMGGKNPVSKNIGGEIRISEVFGKKVSIKEKILVK